MKRIICFFTLIFTISLLNACGKSATTSDIRYGNMSFRSDPDWKIEYDEETDTNTIIIADGSTIELYASYASCEYESTDEFYRFLSSTDYPDSEVKREIVKNKKGTELIKTTDAENNVLQYTMFADRNTTTIDFSNTKGSENEIQEIIDSIEYADFKSYIGDVAPGFIETPENNGFDELDDKWETEGVSIRKNSNWKEEEWSSDAKYKSVTWYWIDISNIRHEIVFSVEHSGNISAQSEEELVDSFNDSRAGSCELDKTFVKDQQAYIMYHLKTDEKSSLIEFSRDGLSGGFSFDSADEELVMKMIDSLEFN